MIIPNDHTSDVGMKILVIQGIKSYRGDEKPLTVQPNDILLSYTDEMLLSMYTFLVQADVLMKIKNENKK